MNEKPKGTNLPELLHDLDAGTFVGKLNRAISDLSLACVNTGKKAELTITLSMKRIGESHQVAMTHGIRSTKPLERGKVAETHESDTPLYVGSGGRLLLFPERQEPLFPPIERKMLD